MRHAMTGNAARIDLNQPGDIAGSKDWSGEGAAEPPGRASLCRPLHAAIPGPPPWPRPTEANKRSRAKAPAPTRVALRRRGTAAGGIEEGFRVYCDTAQDCLFQVGVTQAGDFVYEMLNPVALAHAGASLEEVLGRTPVQVLGQEIGGLITRGLERVRSSRQPYAYEPTIDFGGRTIIYDALYTPILNTDGTVRRILGRARDITQSRQLEASLLQAQKMEALGHLAGGVAHDFNNVLMTMAGCLRLLGRQADANGAMALLAEAHRSVEHGAALTARLLAFIRQQPLASAPVDVNCALAGMAVLLDRTLGQGIRVITRAAPGLWPAMADRNQLELALLNLAINARDAMPEGGKVTITTRNARIAEVSAQGMKPGDYVAIAFADTGVGMNPEVLARAQEPFFTTKPTGHGSGLGLSMVQGMLRQAGGGMELASRPGEGTCVTLFLPAAPTAR